MPEGDEADIVLRGVVRVENIESPQQYIPRLLERVRKQHLERTYEISGWEDATDFLAVLGRKGGRLLKGGEIDESGGTYTLPKVELIKVAKMVINDFLRGKIPWYIPDPNWPERKAKEKDGEEFGGNEGRLGEMRLKVAKNDSQVGDSDSWDGLDVESDDDKEKEQAGDESDLRGANRDDDLENDRIEDPRPPKKVRL